MTKREAVRKMDNVDLSKKVENYSENIIRNLWWVMNNDTLEKYYRHEKFSVKHREWVQNRYHHEGGK